MLELSYQPSISEFRIQSSNPFIYSNILTRLRCFAIHDYYPVNFFGSNVDENIQKVRRLIFDFKDGKNASCIAKIVSDSILKLNLEVKEQCLVIIPASTQDKTFVRFHHFCLELSSLTGVINGYSSISTEDHEQQKGKVGVDKTLFLTFNNSLYKDKNVLLFDDITTSGTSFNQVAKKLLNTGAVSVTGLFFAKTVSHQ